MEMTSWFLAFIVATLVFVGYVTIINASERKENLRDRVRRLNPAGGDGEGEEVSLLSFDEEKSGMSSMMEWMVSLTGVSLDEKRKELQLTMTRAGIQTNDGLIRYLFLKRLGLPIFCGLFLIPVITSLLSPATGGAMKAAYFIVGALLAIIGLKGADLYVHNKTLKRKKVLERSFPDALDLLLVCVESGLALDGALSRVTRELGRAHPDVTNELNRTRLELTLLNDRTVALQNLAERTDLVPFRSLVSTLIQTEKFGTSLADTLRVLSEDYRLTRLMVAENKAGRLPTLMTIPLITFMLPALIMILIAPPIIRVIAQGGLFGTAGQ